MTRGYTQPPDWKRTTRRILDRDHHHCYLCGAAATEVDHIRCVAEDGGHDDDNLSAICRACHTRKSATEAARGRARWFAQTQRPVEPHPGLLPH